MEQSPGKNILYISYTGLLEPLGQSQVYRYLDRLAERHKITLVTFEKREDVKKRKRFEAMKQRVENAGIQWHPMRYHRKPSLPATIWDLSRGFITCLRSIRRNDIDIVHSRSYVASILALLCKRLFGTTFVFDMRGFWADERIDAGIWDEDDQIYRIAKWFETKFIEQADVVVSLTNAGIGAIRSFDHVDTSNTQFEMIPTCVDLELFTPNPEQRSEDFVVGYVGSVGTWYLFDDVLDCFELIQDRKPEAQLAILNKGDHELIKEKLREHDIDPSVISLKSVQHEQVPKEMNKMDIGIFLIKPTFSKTGSSPTKMGEFLACGVPCLSNAGVGDVEEILESNEVGVAMESLDHTAKQEAVENILKLHLSSEIATRCRSVAKSYYSLSEGVEKYDKIYQSISSDE
ncbi:Glycosyltransferase involved in cell wall bisynthesis [Haloplanus vescus]|uniref:Glycosyltransferase involved in cell wall bisynthesis n=1 Tax=Haloplanus vescus TaxID=555874 RepID=A0A1H3XI67_9EURY|nr:glycosyltransferase family 4 protein [Haloplanus vescus]SDZ98312.1 Glycosyltransferase involved in cell wall bisynthesis [Haloplanus vescus]